MPERRFAITVLTPVGAVTVRENAGALVELDWGKTTAPTPQLPATPLLIEARRQISAYFEGRLNGFDLPLAPQGTAFQQRVWEALSAIPHGRVRTYGELARELVSGARAIGGACGRNPLPILIPCHRVRAAGAAMGGYSGGGGLATKRFLLGLEGSL